MFKTITWDGSPITKPGIYRGIPLSVYHSAHICDGPSLSSSGMRTLFNESPAHFYCNWPGNPDAPEQETSRALVIGSAVHHLILGEDNFAETFAIQPPEYEAAGGEIKKWNNNAGDCKAWHKAIAAEGRTVLLGSEVEMIRGLAKSLGIHPLIRAGALNGQIERSIFWKDEKTGIWLKSRPDTIPGDSGDFVDLKTTDSVQWRDLVRSIGKFSYHQQGSLIRRAAREALGIENPTFSLVFVEKDAPYCVRVVTLKDNDLDRGDKQNRVAIDVFASCLKAKRWPGPGGNREDAEPIELSDYEHKRIDDDLVGIKGA